MPRVVKAPIRHKFAWPAVEILHGVREQAIPAVEFSRVLFERRTVRYLDQPARDETLSLIKCVMQRRFVRRDEFSERTRKAAMSAGALHAIDVIALMDDDGPILYDDETDAFLRLAVLEPGSLAAFQRSAQALAPHASGHMILLAAHTQRVASVYDQYESLFWRDAGALLQTLAMTAFAYGLGFCPLGLLGHDGLAAIAGDKGLQAVGVAILGRPPIMPLPHG